MIRLFAIVLATLGAADLAAQSGPPVVTRKLTLGCEGCETAQQFGSIWDVSISPTGDVLVTDRDAPMLRRFDATGRLVWSGGRKGKGPGEYTLPVRASLTPNGIVIVDMTNMRLTDLSPAGDVKGTSPLTNMPMAVAVSPQGGLVIASDDFRGTLTMLERKGGAPLTVARKLSGSRMNASVALAGDGSTAVILDNAKYEIQRFDASGKALPPITRDIPRVRRTPEEEAEMRARMSRARGMVAAEAKKSGGTPSRPPLPGPDELTLKDHLRLDGLRFDAAGRLWVMTQRGDERSTVFDVFSPAGALIGTVTVPERVGSYSLAGNWMVTGGENAEGIPTVVVWTVRP